MRLHAVATKADSRDASSSTVGAYVGNAGLDSRVQLLVDYCLKLYILEGCQRCPSKFPTQRTAECSDVGVGGDVTLILLLKAIYGYAGPPYSGAPRHPHRNVGQGIDLVART